MNQRLKLSFSWIGTYVLVVTMAAGASLIRQGWLYDLDGWQRMHIYAAFFSVLFLLLFGRWLLPKGKELQISYLFSVAVFVLCALLNYLTAPYYWAAEKTLSFAFVVVVVPLVVWLITRWTRKTI